MCIEDTMLSNEEGLNKLKSFLYGSFDQI